MKRTFSLSRNNFIIVIYLLLTINLWNCSEKKKALPVKSSNPVKEQPVQSDNPVIVQTRSFEDRFTKIKEINLSSKVVIGAIGAIDVFKKDNILVTDVISKKVFLFDNEGNLLKVLQPENCTPGFKLIPSFAMFNKKGDIYVINEIASGYIFNNNGDCIGAMDNFMHYPHVAFLNDGDIIAYSNKGDGNYLVLATKTGKQLQKFGIFPNSYKHIIEIVRGGGLVTDDKNFIYQANVIGPEIIVYKGNKFSGKIENYNVKFNSIGSDIKNPSDPLSMVNKFKELTINNTIIENLFLADSNLLLIQLYHEKKYSAQLVSTDGDKYLNKAIQLDSPFIFAKDGYAYDIIQPKPIKNRLPNPLIIVYKINF